MKRSLTLIFHFYKPIISISLLFTALGLFNFFKMGIEYLNVPLFIKLFGYAITAGYQYFFSAKSFFYFRNAGYSIRRMYVYVFSLDLSFYLLLMIVTYLVTK
jgi:hypothetical protein